MLRKGRPNRVTFTQLLAVIQPMKYLLLLNLLVVQTAFGQMPIEGYVTDSKSGSPLAFVTVSTDQPAVGTYTDINGYFRIEYAETERLTFSYVGYQEAVLTKWQNPLSVSLTKSTYDLGVAEILPGINPAHRIIDSALVHKKSNDPERNLQFSYTAYNKFTFDVVLDSAIGNHPDRISKLDSSDQEAVDFAKSQHLMLLESVSKRRFMPPDWSNEEIIANKISGFQNPQYSMLASDLQSFSFYKDKIKVGDYEYVSPLINRATEKYLFIIEDTTVFANDSVFILSFRPRTGKNFKGLKGILHISTNRYGVKHVVAEPAEREELYNIRIQQKNELFENQYWFPVQLNSFLDFPMATDQIFSIVGEGRSYIDSLRVDKHFRRRDFSNVVLEINPKAADTNDEVWNKYRNKALDERDLKTYHVLDSVFEAENVEQLLKAYAALLSGRFPLGRVDLDLNRILGFNNHEGTRLGAGIHTNDKVARWMSLGAYGAYGVGDKKWKYGGDLSLFLDRRKDFILKGSYANDVSQTGGIEFNRRNSFLAPSTYYRLFVDRMDQVERYQADLTFKTLGDLGVNFYGKKERRLADQGYEFAQMLSEDIVVLDNDLSATEVGFEVRYSYKEKFIRTSNRKISLGSKYPTVYFNYRKGVDLLDGEYSYSKYEFLTEKTFRFPMLGETSFALVAGHVDSDVPLPLAYNTSASYARFSIVTPFAFETMRVNEFQSDEFVNFFFRHNFLDLLLSGEKFASRFTIIASAGIGRLRDETRHRGFEVKDYEKIYTEAGLQIDNIFALNYTAFGIATLYRFGAYALPEPKDNIAVKLSFTYNL